MILYSALLGLVLVVGAPWWLLRMATSGRYRAGLRGRLGVVPTGLREFVAGREVVWIHAVSVGEVMAAERLVRELETALPGCAVVVSTTTETGQALACKRLGAGRVFYLPLDFAFTVRRYLGALRPRMVVLMESELWPRLMTECRRGGIALAVVNARVSDRSFPRYMKLRALWRPLLAGVGRFFAQSEETAERLRRIGVATGRVVVTGNLKYDVRAVGENAMAGRVEEAVGDGPLLVAGSTLPGEEEILLAAWAEVTAKVPAARLLIAPRHPNRFDEVFRLIEERYTVVRCSGLEGAEAGGVLLLDTIGDLAAVYGLGTAAFVGGSLVAMGGHNPLEAAQFGVPVVMGESYENFREIVEAMRGGQAIRIVTREALSDTLVEVMQSSEAMKTMGERGRAVFEAQAGATGRTVAGLLSLLGDAR